MAYDLEEQEQLDEFKAWWALHGKKVVTLVTVLVASYLGYQGCHHSSRILKRRSSEKRRILLTGTFSISFP